MRNHIKSQSFLVIAVMFTLTSILFASTTGKISGRVTDSSTGEGLAGANIMIENSGRGTSSDENGNYFIINVPVGRHDISASYIGYEKMTMTGVIVNAGKTADIDYSLNSTAVEGAAVTVVAERPIIQKDLTASEHIITSDDIERSYARSLLEHLETKPGVYKGRFRGGSTPSSVYMLDGVSLNTGLMSENYQGINPTSIEEITIQTGGYNAEYGAAMSGIVNVVTKQAQPNSGIHGSVMTRYRPAGKYHWGDHMYSTDGWDYTNHDLSYWTARSADSLDTYYGQSPNDLLSQWVAQITPDGVIGDYDQRAQSEVEVTVYGSPSDKINFLGSYRFLKGVNIFPQPTEYNPEMNLQGKLGFKVSDAITLDVNVLYASAETADRGLQGSTDFGFNSTERGWEGTWFHPPMVTDPYNGNKLDMFGSFSQWPLLNTFSNYTVKMTHVLNPNTFYDVSYSMLENDEDSSDRDNLINQVDANGDWVKVHATDNVKGMLGYYQTQGYFQRWYFSNTKVNTFSASITSQVNNNHGVKAGVILKSYDFSYEHKLTADYSGSRWNLMNVFDGQPIEGAAYVQDKIEFSGLILNAGVRADWFNQNRDAPYNMYDPTAFQETTEGNVTGNIPGNPPTVSTEMQSAISPRLGFSHPISDNTVLHFNYGHFVQRPSWTKTHGFAYINYHKESQGSVSDPYSQASVSFPERYGGFIGNPYLTYERTIQYEVGFDQHVQDKVRLDVTAYYKDGTRLTSFQEGNLGNGYNTGAEGSAWTGVRNIQGRGAGWVVANKSFSDIRGIEVSANTTLPGPVSGTLSMDQSFATGGSAGFNTLYEDVNSIDEPASYQQYKKDWLSNFMIKGVINLSLDKGVLSGLNVNLYTEYFQGPQYTYHGPNDFSTEPNNKRWEPHKRTNLKVSKAFQLGSFSPEITIEIRNLLNDKDLNILGGAALTEYEENGNLPKHGRSGEDNEWGWYNQFTNPPRQVIFQLKLDF